MRTRSNRAPNPPHARGAQVEDKRPSIHPPREARGGSELEIDQAPLFFGPPARQLQQRLIHIEAMNVVTQLSPQEALSSGPAADIGNFEDATLTACILRHTQNTIPKGPDTLKGGRTLAPARIVLVKLLVAAKIPAG